MDAKRDDPLKFWWLLLLGAAATIASLTLALHFEPKHLVLKILIAAVAELGFAAIIAYVIILVVDKKEKEEFRSYLQRSERRLASKAVLSYLLDTELPVAVSDQLEEFIAGSALVKRHQNLTFKLTEIRDNRDWLLMAQVSDYVAYNATSSHIKEDLYISFDYDPQTPADVLKMCYVETIKVEKRGASQNEFKPVDNIPANRKSPLSDYKQEHIPIDLAPYEEVRVCIEALRPKRVRDNELWRNAYLCETLTMNLRYNKGLLSAGHTMIHPKRTTGDFREADDGLTIECNEPLLRANGVLFWWHPHTDRAGRVREEV